MSICQKPNFQEFSWNDDIKSFFVLWGRVEWYWHMGMSYLTSLNPQLFKNTAYVGLFERFSVQLFLHVFCNSTKTSANSSALRFRKNLNVFSNNRPTGTQKTIGRSLNQFEPCPNLKQSASMTRSTFLRKWQKMWLPLERRVRVRQMVKPLIDPTQTELSPCLKLRQGRNMRRLSEWVVRRSERII